FETFETGYWNYAHPEYFTLSSQFYIGDGVNTQSLRAHGDSNGVTYDGVQYERNIPDCTIETWMRAHTTQYQVGALWLRTDQNDPEANPTFQNGYCVLLYRDYAEIRKYVNGVKTTLDYQPLNQNWLNTWWHVKFQAEGSSLKAWIQKQGSSQIFELTATDTTFSDGKPGFSARTNLDSGDPPTIRTLFFDELKISINHWYKELKSNYGYGVDILSIYRSTHIGWDVNPLDPYNPYFSGTSNACPLVSGIITLIKQVDITLSIDDFNDPRDEDSIFINIGDPLGYAPGDCSAPNEGTNEINGAFFGVNPYDETSNVALYGWGIIDAYEIYLYVT
ncbi:MAG: S8/S53 family peptidase, partial [Candidatus Heimdallarchaeota archaeon]|nr:S8/S53 family peptidase [Candidatus Heimdallarchaeota archaeon]MCK4878640.1 S8/S53 family peptidase [Candidatus Heimdallarchaeota archaeon]